MASGLSPDSQISWGLDRLLAPHRRETFLAQHWESQPLHVARGDTDYYSDLLTLKDVDRLVSTASIGARQVTVVGGAPGPRDEEGADADAAPTRPATSPGGPEWLYERFRAGATLVLSFLQDRCPPLRDFCNGLGRELSAGVQANAYVTPGHAQGLAAHYDTHDVIVVQIFGAKRWKLYGAPVELPLGSQHYRRDEHQPSDPPKVIDLQAGDLLYVPRGVVHEAQSLDSISVHLAVGILGITWADVLHAAVDLFAGDQAAARHSLPVGFARLAEQRARAEAAVPGMLEDLGRYCRPSALINHAAAVATTRLTPDVDGYLCGIAAGPDLALSTPLHRDDHNSWSIDLRDDERLMLGSGTRFLSMPARLEPELTWLRDAPTPVAAQDLPGALLPVERLTLFRRLLQDGFLRIDGP